MTENYNDNEIEFQEENSLHHYRTEIPNIIFFMNLEPYEFKAYAVFKWTAGDKGKCFKSNATLCEEIGCANPKFIQIKKSLEEKGLIKITKRIHENGGTLPDLITIVDLWTKNMKEIPGMMQEKKKARGGNLGLPGGVILNKGGGNLGLPKQEHKEEEQKQQQHTPYKSPGSQGSAAAVAAVSFSSSEEREDDKDFLEDPWPSRQVRPQETKVPAAVAFYSCLEDIDISEADKREITSRYTEQIVIDALEAVTEPTFKVKSTLVQALKFACSRSLKPVKFANLEKQSQVELNRKDSEAMDGKENARKTVRIIITSQGVEFTYLTCAKIPEIVLFNEIGFKSLVTSLLVKHGFISSAEKNPKNS